MTRKHVLQKIAKFPANSHFRVLNLETPSYGTGLNETARILQYGRPALKEKLGGEDPTGVAFFDKELDSQAAPIAKFFKRLANEQIKLGLVDLGRVKAKHELQLELRCFTHLPNHVAFPFESPMAQGGTPHPAFLTEK